LNRSVSNRRLSAETPRNASMPSVSLAIIAASVAALYKTA
jgi:hypothetical protein